MEQECFAAAAAACLSVWPGSSVIEAGFLTALPGLGIATMATRSKDAK